MPYILSIDQGTTSTRTLLFDHQGKPQQREQHEFAQHYPQDGWVEHDPEDIWQTTRRCCQAFVKDYDITAIGISNQRETTLIWDRQSGKPIYNAIVWQDRRTSDTCKALQPYAEMLQRKTGLLLDPYFSATKIAWLLEHIPGARDKAERGDLVFGTVDTFLIWRLTGGKRHVTDASNAARTALFNIHTQTWDDELLQLFNIPKAILPDVLDNCADFGVTESSLIGKAIPITGVAGDQQAAMIGQRCFMPGMIKSTYGTGSFLMLNTGKQVLTSSHRLLSTMAYRINGEATYGLEGSIFNAGTTLQWLRDRVHLINDAKQSEAMALSVKDNHGVYFVPAFTGLGAPYWDPSARAAILGLTRDSSDNEIVRAALEAVCYQTKDLLHAMAEDGASLPKQLRVDGGMVANNWLLQFLADIIDAPVERPNCIETSAQGAALLAGVGAGVFSDLQSTMSLWQADQCFTPKISLKQQQKYYQGWQTAVKRVL